MTFSIQPLAIKLDSMSNSFSGSSTRGMSELDREIESRTMSVATAEKKKRLDVFTDDFGGRGTSEQVPGADFTKSKQPFEDSHDDTSSADIPRRQNDKGLRPMAAAGRASDQQGLNDVDAIESQIQQRIKPEQDQFPGAKKMSSEKKLAMDTNMSGEQFSGEVEKRMEKKLSAVDHGSVVKSYVVDAIKIEIYKDSSGMFGALVQFPNGGVRSNGMDFRTQAEAQKYADQAAKNGLLRNRT